MEEELTLVYIVMYRTGGMRQVQVFSSREKARAFEAALKPGLNPVVKVRPVA